MSKTTKWIIGIAAALVFFFGLFLLMIFSWILSSDDEDVVSSGGQRIAMIELRETITTSDDIVRQLKKFREQHAVKAIVLRVDSPGGGVAASQEIYEEVRKTREAGTPVVVSMGSVAASGGYYVSCGASRIVANPGTLTGSIGVIMQFIGVSDLLRKLGIDESTIKTGKYKDAGSPFRKVTPEDRVYFNTLVDDVYDQFVDVVAKERHLQKSFVRKYADGRVFTGRQAYALGFVDTLGTMEDAITIAAHLGGITGKPAVVREVRRKAFLDRLLGDAASEISRLRQEVLSQPILQYKLTSPY